jgi:hypothetical protein
MNVTLALAALIYYIQAQSLPKSFKTVSSPALTVKIKKLSENGAAGYGLNG